MKKISELFKIHVARSRSYKDYKAGQTAFVTNGFANNGVIGYVSPLNTDLIFDSEGICVSAFCEATVQKPPFVGRGNGGSGMIVLQPLNADIDSNSLLYYAAYINANIKWRFSYGRMVSKERLGEMKLEDVPSQIKEMKFQNAIPKRTTYVPANDAMSWGSIPIANLFELVSGEHHNALVLHLGKIPLVSCGQKRNGIIKFVSVKGDGSYRNRLTIAYNGQPLTTKYHPYEFIAKDDVAICVEKASLRLTTLMFIQHIVERERWRFSYGRKCFREKLSRLLLRLPIKGDGTIDEDSMASIIKSTPYWNFLRKNYENGVSIKEEIVKRK